MILSNWFIIVCVITKCVESENFKKINTVLEDITYQTINDWFTHLNEQNQELNRQSALYGWELSTIPSDQLYEIASEFGGIRSKWRNKRCSEAELLLLKMNAMQKRMIQMLCRGPEYTVSQASQVSAVLTKMQAIYSGTKICLPQGYDVCINYNRIWDYTYTENPIGEISRLNMTSIRTNRIDDPNPLYFYDGKISENYYIFRGLTNAKRLNPLEIDQKIRNSSPAFCLEIESDLEIIMNGNFNPLKRIDCALPSTIILQWAWEAWRLAVGPDIKEIYGDAIYLMNLGAKNNGYQDIGESWQEELEIDDLRKVIHELWNKFKPYYKLLHGVFRNALWNKYGRKVININAPLPAHLTGNMWSQDWSPLTKLLIPEANVDLDLNFELTNWTRKDMVRRAEDFYTSIGLRQMTEKFWEFSNFEKSSNSSQCHGSAANMYDNDDFRMIVCPNRSLNDFYVIVHEMGHIQYYMEAGDQPSLFQDATNSAFGEAIGDTIFLAMMTPQHLHRLGLISDEYLFPENLTRFSHNSMRIVHERFQNFEFLNAPTNLEILNALLKTKTRSPLILENIKILLEIENQPKIKTKIHFDGIPYPEFSKMNEKMDNFLNFKANNDVSINSFDLTLLLRVAMSKLPQIPFEYIFDVFRWDLFNGKVNVKDANDYFWKLVNNEQGVNPPSGRNNRRWLFDAAAKFHFADNTPYVRYFLASFLQTQIFKGLCEAAVFGKVNVKTELPMPLHRCDIYGSKRAGKLLRKALKLGSSSHWKEVLFILTGTTEISANALIEYYGPLFNWMEKLAVDFEIPLGW